MRRVAVFFSNVLLVALAASAAADAATLDDFVLNGGGHTIAYSLPATNTFPDFPLFNFFAESAAATIDGVSGYTVAGDYYDPGIYQFVSLELSVPEAIFGVPDLILRGQPFIQFRFDQLPVPPFTSTVVPTFVPGTFTESSTPPMAYTLTITQESAVAQTSEPGPFALVATALCVLAIPACRARRNFVRLRDP